MTTEEKARAYDEAIERANELNYVSDKDSLQRKTVEHIFPELKEDKSTWGKEDEQILNAAILHIKNETYNYYGGYSSEDIMQWLKCLKERYTWKPSDEQMDELENEHLKSVPKY